MGQVGKHRIERDSLIRQGKTPVGKAYIHMGTQRLLWQCDTFRLFCPIYVKFKEGRVPHLT